MKNRINRATIALMKEFEGFRSQAYPDPGSRDGHPWTIGYGHTALAGPPDVKPGMVISKQEALKIFERDLNKFAVGVADKVKVPINDNQYGALVSFAYNIGLGGFARSSALRELNAGRFENVPGRMALWCKNDGKVMKGLVRRRAAEGVLFRTPVKKKNYNVNRPKDAPVAAPKIDESANTKHVEVNKGKPIPKSTTIWSTIISAFTGIAGSFFGLAKDQPYVFVFLVLVIAAGAFWVIRERRKYALQEGI